MRCEIKSGCDGFLFVITSLLVPGVKTYVLADGSSATAYGQCPILGLEALGRNGEPSSYRECVERLGLAASEGYEIDGGIIFPLQIVPAGDSYGGIEKFLCRETAELASAVAGWPAPVTVFPAEKDRK